MRYFHTGNATYLGSQDSINNGKVGAKKYRGMRERGETSFPKPVLLDSAISLEIPSREANRLIPCRLFKPEAKQVKGIYLHIHGGGWTFMSEKSLGYLADYAQCCQTNWS